MCGARIVDQVIVRRLAAQLEPVAQPRRVTGDGGGQHRRVVTGRGERRDAITEYTIRSATE